MSFTISGETGKQMNATQRSFETLRVESAVLELNSMTTDVLRFTQRVDDATGAGPVRAEDDQIVQLWQNGSTRRFRGHASVTVDGNLVTTEVRGPWHWMERVPLTGDFTDDNGGTAERKNFVFPTQGLAGSVEDLLDRMIALGIPMQRGTVTAMYTVVKQAFPNMSCAAALSQLLLWCPDAVVWFDYSGTTPEINVTRRGSLTDLTYAVGTHNLTKDGIRLKPRDDQRVTRVELNYVDRHPTTGRRRNQQQVSGTAQLGKLQMITVSGEEQSDFLPKEDYESYSLKTASATISSDYVAKNDSTLAGIRKQYGISGAVGTTVTTYSGTLTTKRADTYSFAGRNYQKSNGSFLTSLAGKYLVITPDVPDWVIRKYNGVEVTITGTWIAQWLDSLRGTGTPWSKSFSAMRAGAVTGSGFENDITVGESAKYKNDWLARPFTVRGVLIDTNFPAATTVYKPWDYAFISPPANLAQNLKDAQNWTPYEGTVELVDDEWSLVNHLNKKLNLTGSLTEHAAMDAPLKTVRYDLTTGRMQLTAGPPPRSGLASLINRIRQEPSKNIEYV